MSPAGSWDPPWSRGRYDCPMSRRLVPRVGLAVEVAFLGARVTGTIEEVGDEGRRVTVLTAEGELLAFGLSRVTGTFLSEDAHMRARLLPAREDEDG